MKTTFEFNTTAGIRRVAAHLEILAADPVNWEPATPDHRIGHLTIRSTYRGLTEAARLLRRNPRASSSSAMQTDVLKMDAVRHCGSPEAALETIRRQIAIQGESMEPSDVKRCERAAALIASHIDEKAQDAAMQAAHDALLARIALGKIPDNRNTSTPEGTQVHLIHNYRKYLGNVVKCKMGTHPVLGKNYPSALYTIRVSHTLESRGRHYNYLPVRPTTIKNVEALSVCILPPEKSSALPSASLGDFCASAVPSLPTLSRNGDKNDIELRFPVKPDTETLAALKKHGFRPDSKRPGQPWWVKYSEEAWVFATGLTERGLHPATGSAEFIPAFIHSSSSGPSIEIATTEPSPERHEEESPAAFATAFADF